MKKKSRRNYLAFPGDDALKAIEIVAERAFEESELAGDFDGVKIPLDLNGHTWAEVRLAAERFFEACARKSVANVLIKGEPGRPFTESERKSFTDAIEVKIDLSKVFVKDKVN